MVCLTPRFRHRFWIKCVSEIYIEGKVSLKIESVCGLSLDSVWGHQSQTLENDVVWGKTQNSPKKIMMSKAKH